MCVPVSVGPLLNRHCPLLVCAKGSCGMASRAAVDRDFTPPGRPRTLRGLGLVDAPRAICRTIGNIKTLLPRASSKYVSALSTQRSRSAGKRRPTDELFVCLARRKDAVFDASMLPIAEVANDSEEGQTDGGSAALLACSEGGKSRPRVVSLRCLLDRLQQPPTFAWVDRRASARSPLGEGWNNGEGAGEGSRSRGLGAAAPQRS